MYQINSDCHSQTDNYITSLFIDMVYEHCWHEITLIKRFCLCLDVNKAVQMESYCVGSTNAMACSDI